MATSPDSRSPDTPPPGRLASAAPSPPPAPADVPPGRGLSTARPPITEAPILDERHQLPAHRGKVGRITDHVKGAAENLTEWIELRIALLRREVKDEIDAAKSQAKTLAKAYGSAALFALLAALILLIWLGFLLSAAWGLLLGPDAALWSLTLGFLTLGLLLGLIAMILFKRAQRKQHELPLFSGDHAPSRNGQDRSA